MPSKLLEDIGKGRFIVSVQIDPPGASDEENGEKSMSAILARFWEAVDAIKQAGIRTIDINSSKSKKNNKKRRIFWDSTMTAMELSRRGFQTIPHVTTRDDSKNGILNKILSARTINLEQKVENFLIITGDKHEGEPANGQAEEFPSDGVYQTDSVGAIRLVDTYLRKESGLEMALLAAINQNNHEAEEGKKIEEKCAAGADAFMSQPVFSKTQADRMINFYANHSDKPLVVGVWPLTRMKTVEAISSGEVEGVVLDKNVYWGAQVRKNEKEVLERWGLERAARLIEYLHAKKVAGVYIVAPSHDPLFTLKLIKKYLQL